MRHVNKAARMSLYHRMIQHRSVIRWVEARTLASDRVFPRHSHDQLGIGIMVSGAHRSWSGIGNVEAHAGDIIMVNPGEMHDGMPLGGGLREWRMLYFDPALVTEFVEAEGVTGIEVIRPAVSDRLLATRFAALFASVIDTEPDLLLLEENLLRLIMCISRCHALRPPPGREPSPSVKKALARLDGDPASAIRLTELAGLAAISRYQLLRAFVREVGATPHAYLVQRRVYLARRLLAAGRPMVEAAMDAGFADQSHLTRAFVRQFGVTPGRYVAALN
jgi:AraC-like DNA-binding protein